MTISGITVVGIGGTTRIGSTSERTLLEALGAAERLGASTRAFLGSDLIQMPIYDPEQESRHPMATNLIEALRTADAVIVASPGYHGGVSGLVKNALDYLEDLRDDDRAYLTGRAWGSIASGAGWGSVYDVLNQLRAIGTALRAWTLPKGIAVGPNNAEGRVARQTELMASDLVWFVQQAARTQ